jgi:3-deoxy-manno-octulosonate cytidylyltransferase (CMP-KDO synthetase)
VKVLVVIPARYGSTRFPGKPLALLRDKKTLIQHVYENSKGSRLASDVVVATDSEEVLKGVTAFGGRAVMTSKEHPSGTDRAAEVASAMDCDIIVNVQGDEPLIRPEMIDAVARLLEDGRAAMGTLAKRIESPGEMLDPNVVKVAFDSEGFAMYFSRAPIPYHRDQWKTLEGVYGSRFTAYKHIGIYSYRKDALIKISRLEPSALERIERLEQLRALENGMRIKVKETSLDTIGVDTPEDLEKVERCLSISS